MAGHSGLHLRRSEKWYLSPPILKASAIFILSCAPASAMLFQVDVKENCSLNIDVYQKPTDRNQFLLFDSHHSLVDKPYVIRASHYRAESIPTETEAKEKEHMCIKTWLPVQWGVHRSLHLTTKQLHKRMDEHRRVSSLGPGLVVHLHLQDKGHTFWKKNKKQNRFRKEKSDGLKER